MAEGALKEGGLGAEPHRLGDRHAGVNAEASGRVGCGLDDPPLVPPAADHQQLDLAQLRMALAAHLDEEGIEVDVENAGRHSWSLHQEDRGCLERHHDWLPGLELHLLD